METLLDATYKTEDDKPVIELFYPAAKKGGDKDIRTIKDFKPYLFAVPKGSAQDLLKEIDSEGFPQVAKLNIVKRTDMSHELDVVEVIVKHPRNVPEIRTKIADLKSCKETREDDIRFVQRYIIDAGLVPMKGARNDKLRIAAFDMETVQRGGKNVPIIISYSDSTGLRRVWNYKHDSKNSIVEKLDDEKAIIRALVDTIRKQGIDLLVTYNGDNFDFPILNERSEALNTPLNMGAADYRLKLERRGMDMAARVTGRPHIDLYPVCRRMFHLPRYTLEDVHQALFDEEKLDIEVEKMAGWWDSGENVDLVLDYAISDTDSCLRIAMEVLPTQYELAQLIRQPIFEVSRMGTGNAIEWLLLKLAHDKKILVPAKPDDREYARRRRDTYEGAYVVEPKKGIHDNILVFDFRSLYPSIIIAHNIDASTINCDCCEKDVHVSPIGAKFCKKRKGLIPELLDDILKSRARTKLEMKKLIAEKGDKTRIKSLDARQQALKILANSAYGYMGFSRARWYNNDCASSVAAWGREYIKDTIKTAEGEGYKVVYGDTDSLMLSISGPPDKKKMEQVRKDLLGKINSKLPSAMELEFEGYYPRGVFVTKKRYALIDSDKRLTIKGLETRRRDWATIAKRTQESVLDTILWENNPQKAAEIVTSVVQELREGKVPLKDLIIHTQLTKPVGEYENVGPHVMAAKKAQKRGKKVKPGDVIQYIVTKKGSSISDKAEMLAFVGENDYDAEYYVNNQVLPAVMRILEALGYQEEELKGLGRQMTLGGF